MNRRQLFKSALAAFLAPTLAKLAPFLPAPRPHLSINQILTISYDKALKYRSTASWSESAFLREAERQGVVRWSNSPRFVNQPMEITLDYRRNPQ